jgi:hypothetical protein
MADQALLAQIQQIEGLELRPAPEPQTLQLFEAGTHLHGFALHVPNQEHYPLKTIAELVDDKAAAKDTAIDALCTTVEFAMASFDHEHGHSISDSDVASELEKLAFKPETRLESPVGQQIEAWLRVELSLSNYSRSDVRTALRRLHRMAKKYGSGRDYLNHIHHLVH